LRGKLKVGWTNGRLVGEDRVPVVICGWEEIKDTHTSHNTCTLNLVIREPAVLATEGHDDDLCKEWDRR